MEESKSFPWQKVVRAAGEGVFTEKAYDAAAKHLKKKAAKFIKKFTPCVAQVDQPAELLKLPDWAKAKKGLLRKLKNIAKKAKGKEKIANEGMCETSGELQQLARMIVVWWVLGPSSSKASDTPAPLTVADTFRGARLLFAGYLFQNGEPCNQRAFARRRLRQSGFPFFC